jgi:hypothetical protein
MLLTERAARQIVAVAEKPLHGRRYELAPLAAPIEGVV